MFDNYKFCLVLFDLSKKTCWKINALN